MDAKLLQTRLVENELGRLIEGTQVALPKQVPRKERTKKRDRKGKGKEAALDGVPVEGGVAGGDVAGTGEAGSSTMDGLVVEGGGGTGEVRLGDAGGGGRAIGIEAAAVPPPPPPPAVEPPPMEDLPEVVLGPTAAALVAQADAEGLGVVNYRRRRGRG